MITVVQRSLLHDLLRIYPDHRMAKFCLQAPSWYEAAHMIARQLGLCAPIAGLSILDIGCGFGFFVGACQELGHTATGLDAPEPIIREAARILRVCYVPHTVQAGQPLPDELRGYDLVTTFGVNFRLPSGTYWTAEEYRFLAADIRPRLLPGGRWVLRPNQTRDGLSLIADLMLPTWWQQVAGPDATIKPSIDQIEISW